MHGFKVHPIDFVVRFDMHKFIPVIISLIFQIEPPPIHRHTTCMHACIHVYTYFVAN